MATTAVVSALVFGSMTVSSVFNRRRQERALERRFRGVSPSRMIQLMPTGLGISIMVAPTRYTPVITKNGGPLTLTEMESVTSMLRYVPVLT